MFSGKKILITGGTGSWGNELTSQLLIVPILFINLKKVQFEEYNSKSNLMDINKLEELLRKGGFIN